MKTSQVLEQNLSTGTQHSMADMAERFNAIEPGVGYEALLNFDMSFLFGAIGLIALAAVVLSQALSARYAYKRAKLR